MLYPLLPWRFSARCAKVLLHCSLEQACSSLLGFFFSLRFLASFPQKCFFMPKSLSCIFDSRGGDEILQECWEEEQVGRLKGRADDGDFSGGEKGCGLWQQQEWKKKDKNSQYRAKYLVARWNLMKQEKKCKVFSSNSFFSPVNWRVSPVINCFPCHKDANQTKTRLTPVQYYFYEILAYGGLGH